MDLSTRGFGCGGGTGVHIQFFEDRFQVSLDGVGGDVKFLGDFLVG
jgi:hypothetical protein